MVSPKTTLQVVNEKFNIEKQIVEAINKSVNEGLSFVDAALHVAEVFAIDVETVGAIIKKDIKIKTGITDEANALNFLKRDKTQVPPNKLE